MRALRGAGAITALAVVAAAAGKAAAHLPLGDRSLVALVAASEAMVLARSLEATAAPAAGGESRTRFAILEPLAGGSVAEGEISVVGAAPHLRYPARETAIVLLGAGSASERVRRSPQRAGLRIALSDGELDAGTKQALRDLWAATHPAMASPPGEAPWRWSRTAGAAGDPRVPDAREADAREADARRVTASLAALAGGPEPRLRSLGALDLAQMAMLHPEDFAAATRERMAAAQAASDDPSVRGPLELALRRLDGGAAEAIAAAPGGK